MKIIPKEMKSRFPFNIHNYPKDYNGYLYASILTKIEFNSQSVLSQRKTFKDLPDTVLTKSMKLSTHNIIVDNYRPSQSPRTKIQNGKQIKTIKGIISYLDLDKINPFVLQEIIDNWDPAVEPISMYMIKTGLNKLIPQNAWVRMNSTNIRRIHGSFFMYTFDYIKVTKRKIKRYKKLRHTKQSTGQKAIDDFMNKYQDTVRAF